MFTLSSDDKTVNRSDVLERKRQKPASNFISPRFTVLSSRHQSFLFQVFECKMMSVLIQLITEGLMYDYSHDCNINRLDNFTAKNFKQIFTSRTSLLDYDCIDERSSFIMLAAS